MAIKCGGGKIKTLDMKTGFKLFIRLIMLGVIALALFEGHLCWRVISPLPCVLLLHPWLNIVDNSKNTAGTPDSPDLPQLSL